MAEIWSRNFPGADEVLLVRLEDRGVLQGLLPLVSRTRRSEGLTRRSLEPMGQDQCEYWDFMIRSQELESGLLAMLQALRSRPGWDELVFDRFCLGTPGLAALRTAAARAGLALIVEEDIPCPVLLLDGGFNQVLTQRFSAKTRSEFKRKRRKLEKVGEVLLEELDETDAIMAALPEVIAADRRGWKWDKGLSVWADPVRRAFMEMLCQRLSGQGLCLLHLLRLDGRVISYNLSFCDADVLYISLVSFDDDYAAYSPGMLTKLFCVECACRRGMRVIDFGRGHGLDKKFWTDLARMNMRATVYAPGARGRMAWLARRARLMARALKRRRRPAPWQGAYRILDCDLTGAGA